MREPALELAEILRKHGPAFRLSHRLAPDQLRAMRAIEICRTAALGGHIDKCEKCEQTSISYNSCRNRHCPKCQSLARAQWLVDRQEELLPVEYFHVVFTLPESFNSLALQNKEVVYDLLFRAASQTLLQIAKDPKHLGAEIGFLAVLHTWGQTLLLHPHLHCIVPGGGLSPDGSSWITGRKGFFLPVRVLSRLFRNLFLKYLQQAFSNAELYFHGSIEQLAQPSAFSLLLQDANLKEWVVYAKRPMGGPAAVLNYLGQYTHRVAISNHRLLKLESDQVSFSWRDYRDSNEIKQMSLDVEEFIRRFLLHILPDGFQRIRYFGYLSNRHRTQKLALCKKLLADNEPIVGKSKQKRDWKLSYEQLTGHCLNTCPICGKGRMITIETFNPSSWVGSLAEFDSS